jgi:septum formation protein
MQPIILASASPRRKNIFEMMNIPVIVQPSSIEEIAPNGKTPGETVCILAGEKADDVAGSTADGIIISADTIVVLGETILGKPDNHTEAASMLKKLSGREHSVYSGVCVIYKNSAERNQKRFTFFERTKVTFSPLEEWEIEQYIKTGSPLDKAGAYGIQDDMGSLFVKKIEGDYYNVVGFPINAFYQTLKRDHHKLFRQIFSL